MAQFPVKVTKKDLLRLRQVMQKHKRPESMELALSELDAEFLNHSSESESDVSPSPPLVESWSETISPEENMCSSPLCQSGYDCFKMTSEQFAKAKYTAAKHLNQ